MRTPQLVQTVTDRLPDAVVNRLPVSKTRTSRITGKRLAIGGSILAVLAALGTAAARKRFVAGTSEVANTTSLDDGRLLVALTDGTTLVVPANMAQQAKTVATTGARVDYRTSRATIGGIPAGMVSRAAAHVDD